MHFAGTGAWQVASGANSVLCLGSAVYAGCACYRVATRAKPTFTAETKDIPDEELRNALATVHTLSAGSAVAALGGTLCFTMNPTVPVWLPLSGAAGGVILYVTRRWNELFSARNNAYFAENTALLTGAAFCGGWAAGPIAHLFGNFLFRYYAPISIGTLLGYATASQIASSNGLYLALHGPLAGVCFGAGLGALVPLARTEQNYAKAGVVYSAVVASAVGSAALSLHGVVAVNNVSVWELIKRIVTSPIDVFRNGIKPPKKHKDEEDGIDVATSSLMLTLAGAAMFYKLAKRMVRKGVRTARGNKAGKKACFGVVDYDAVGASMLMSVLVSMLYLRALRVARGEVSVPVANSE